jgi:hypothetical protein
MSAKNGDKSRFQINRKRGVLRRVKARKLLAEAKRASQAPPAQERKNG